MTEKIYSGVVPAVIVIDGRVFITRELVEGYNSNGRDESEIQEQAYFASLEQSNFPHDPIANYQRAEYRVAFNHKKDEVRSNLNNSEDSS